MYNRPGRSWSCGQVSGAGSFAVADETAGAQRFTIDTTGAATIQGALNLGGTLAGSSAVLSGGMTASSVTANGGQVVITAGSASPNPVIFMSDGSGNRTVVYFEVSTGRSQMTDVYSASALYLDPTGTFTYSGGTGTAYKTGGGSWTAPSDARIKDVLGEYASGLAEVIQLRPVRYVYKGNDNSGAADAPSMHAKAAVAGTEFIGLVAQEAEQFMPEMVASKPGWIDGVAVDDVRELDTSALIFALVNAVRELAGRVATLEGTGAA
jgi:hypothetical protein